MYMLQLKGKGCEAGNKENYTIIYLFEGYR